MFKVIGTGDAGYGDAKHWFPFSIPSASVSFYKCASVNTSAKTWTGYLATLTGGKYSYASSATSGLQYTSVTPVVGSTYTADALAKASYLYTGFPTENLILHIPLEISSATASTGQALTEEGDVNFVADSVLGRSVFQETSNGRVVASLTLPSPTNGVSLCYWMNATQASSWAVANSLYGTASSRGGMALQGSSLDTFNYGSDTASLGTSIPFNAWVFVALVSNGTDVKVYKNGLLSSTVSVAIDLQNPFTFRAGGPNPDQTDQTLSIKLASARVYNRVLTQEEITQLANEFII